MKGLHKMTLRLLPTPSVIHATSQNGSQLWSHRVEETVVTSGRAHSPLRDLGTPAAGSRVPGSPNALTSPWQVASS